MRKRSTRDWPPGRALPVPARWWSTAGRRKRNRHRPGWSTPGSGKCWPGCSARELSRAGRPPAAARRPRAARLPEPPGTGPGRRTRSPGRAGPGPPTRHWTGARRPRRRPARPPSGPRKRAPGPGRRGPRPRARPSRCGGPGAAPGAVHRPRPRRRRSRAARSPRPDGPRRRRKDPVVRRARHALWSAQPRAGTWPARPNRPPRADRPRPRVLPGPQADSRSRDLARSMY